MDEDLGVPPWLRKHRKPPYPKYPKYPKPTIHGASAVGACFRRNSSWICDFGTASTGWQHLEKWQIYASNWCLFVNPTYLLRRGVKQGCMPSIRTVYHESYSGSENGLSPMLRQIQSNPYTEPSKYTWQVEKCHGKRENVGLVVLRRPWGYAYPANRPDIHAGSPIQVAPRKTPKPHESMALSKNWIPQNHPKSHVSFQLGTWKFIENLGIPWKSQLRGNFEVSISGQSRSSSPGRAPEVLCPARHGNASEHQKISPEAPPGVAQSQTQVGDG